MKNAKRGRGTRHWVYPGAIAALGLALSGCGGAASTPAAAQSTAPAQSTASAATAGTGSSASASTSSTASSTSSGSSSSDPPVTAKANTVTIAWTPPTENTNGTPLSNLAGYNIHYGTSASNLSEKISVSNPGIATYVVSNLSPGTYYFAVAAVNSAGIESPLSAEVSAIVTN